MLKAFERVEVRLHKLLHSEVDRDEWLISSSGQFIPRDTGPGFRWLGDQVCLRGGLGVDKKRSLLPLSSIEAEFPDRSGL